MSKETISQTEGLCKEVANCIRNAYDRGYKQGQKDMEQNTMAVLENGKMIGREEAWECAKKIVGDVVEPHFESAYMVDIFGCESAITAMTNNSASEAIAKTKEYEEKQKAEDIDSEIKTGDEVIYDDNKGIACSEPFPVGIDEELFVDVWFGSCMIRTTLKYVKKTGKHYYHMSEILEQLKGE